MTKERLNIDSSWEDYIDSTFVREPEILARLRKETAEMGALSRMQISAEQGQLMAFLVELLGMTRLLEIGTFTGYSALACALALPESGQLIACDVSEVWTAVAQRYWEEAEVSHKISLRLAQAEETLNELLASGQAETFHMIFIDADKAGYDQYYEYGLQLLQPGGIILIDNVLWGGAVADSVHQDADTQAIRALNAKIKQDERVTLAWLPLADGLTMVRKRSQS